MLVFNIMSRSLTGLFDLSLPLIAHVSRIFTNKWYHLLSFIIINRDNAHLPDLSIAPVLTFLKCRPKFWAKVPEKVKEYYTRVLEAFPDTKENFDMLDGMCTGYTGEGADCEP